MSALFPGPASPLPGPSSGRVTFLAVTGQPTEPVRHAAGYEPFVALVERSGVDPASLASDIAAFGAFVHAHRESLEDEALAEAAAIFLGDVLAVLHPRASWRVPSEPEIGTDAVSMPVRGALASMRDEPGFTRRMAAELPSRWREADARHDAIEAGMAMARAAADAAVLEQVPDLVLPLSAVGPFLDERGDAIPYGDRWTYPAGPPDDAYSRVTHPERFAPLHGVAEALIAHLDEHYDVETTWSEAPRAALLRPRTGAPVRFVLTDLPGVRLRIGLLLDEAYPACGCDACDETVMPAADSLVASVLGVVAGGFAERLVGPAGPGATSLRLPDGSGSGSGGGTVPDDPLVDPAEVAALGGAAWPAWPLRR